MSREESLEWITDFLELKDIPYLICGGLAAIAYGSHRPLYDIDLYVPEKNYMMVVKFGRKYITYGPERLINEHWNVNYVQFNFKGQKIEVGSSKNLHIYDSTKQEWYQKKLKFNKYKKLTVLGKSVRIMEKQELIDYKQKLNRKVDQIDIEQIIKA